MIHKREDEIRAALREHWPALNYRQIGKLLDVRLWSKVRLVHQAMLAEVTPVEILADDVPAATDVSAPRLRQIAVNPVICCERCGREGTPANDRPTWCKPCASGMGEARAAWPTPPTSAGAQTALALIPTADAAALSHLRRHYLRARAIDFGILEA